MVGLANCDDHSGVRITGSHSVMPSLQTKVSALTMPEASIARISSSSTGPDCWPFKL